MLTPEEIRISNRALALMTSNLIRPCAEGDFNEHYALVANVYDPKVPDPSIPALCLKQGLERDVWGIPPIRHFCLTLAPFFSLSTKDQLHPKWLVDVAKQPCGGVSCFFFIKLHCYVQSS